jgi:hypothetical protein
MPRLRISHHLLAHCLQHMPSSNQIHHHTFNTSLIVLMWMKFLFSLECWLLFISSLHCNPINNSKDGFKQYRICSINPRHHLSVGSKQYYICFIHLQILIQDWIQAITYQVSYFRGNISRMGLISTALVIYISATLS